jgi:hypothetical protein
MQPNISAPRTSLTTTACLIRASQQHKGPNKNSPLYLTLQRNHKRANPGWLRRNEAVADSRPTDFKKHLDDKEKSLLLQLNLILQSLKLEHTTTYIAHAWGIHRTTVIKIASGNLDTTRKKRSDAGKTVLTSADKAKAVLTAEAMFKRQKTIDSRGEEALSTAELNELWKNLEAAKKQAFAFKASELLQ